MLPWFNLLEIIFCFCLLVSLCMSCSFISYGLSFLLLILLRFLYSGFIFLCATNAFLVWIFFFFFIYLASPDLSCSMWDLVPWRGIEPVPPALEAQSLNHWASREVPTNAFLKTFKNFRCSYMLFPLWFFCA